MLTRAKLAEARRILSNQPVPDECYVCVTARGLLATQEIKDTWRNRRKARRWLRENSVDGVLKVSCGEYLDTPNKI